VAGPQSIYAEPDPGFQLNADHDKPFQINGHLDSKALCFSIFIFPTLFFTCLYNLLLFSHISVLKISKKIFYKMFKWGFSTFTSNCSHMDQPPPLLFYTEHTNLVYLVMKNKQ